MTTSEAIDVAETLRHHPDTLSGAAHDTMDPKHMAAMARALPQGRYLHCPDGSHLAIYDDQAVYMSGLLAFLREVGDDTAD